MKEKLDHRITNAKAISGRFSIIPPSKQREGSTIPPPDTPLWAVAEEFRDPHVQFDTLEIQGEEK